MGKFCISCGTALNEGAKFCTKCGAKTSLVSEESVVQPDPATPKGESILSKAGKKVNSEAKAKAVDYAKSIISDAIPASQSAGELSLPSELVPITGNLAGEGLLSLLKDGFGSLARGFKGTLQDKKRIVVVIALVITWLVVNLLAALDIFSLPVQVLSWLTSARGSLIGGSIGKGLIAALLAQTIADKGMLQSLKGGINKLTGAVRDGKKAYTPLLLGAGAALIICNLIVFSSFQNMMVCIAAFVLSAKALAQKGFLRQTVSRLLPKANDNNVTGVMGGWTLGFALFAAVSILPGGKNGYVLGILLILAGSIFTVVGRNKKEVTAE